MVMTMCGDVDLPLLGLFPLFASENAASFNALLLGRYPQSTVHTSREEHALTLPCGAGIDGCDMALASCLTVY